MARAIAVAFGRRCFLPLLLAALLPFAPAFASDSAKLFATTEKGFARIIIDFPNRYDLPAYHMTSTNGVLAVEFDQPVDFTVPDIQSAAPDYVTIARVDSDGRGIRFGLRTTFTVNHTDAGEQLYIDLMPSTWQGLPPPLPPEIIAKLAERAKLAAIKAEEARKAEEVKALHPVASLAVGRNPTFLRLEFTWSTDTVGKFGFDGKTGNLEFDWPVPVDLSQLKVDLPAELPSVDNQVTGAASRILLHTAPNVVPRFYAVTPRDFIVDIDTASTVPANPNPVATATAKAVAAAMADAAPKTADVSPWAKAALPIIAMLPQPPITPQIVAQNSIIRVTFPFDRDTPAAVFRRGDVVWMLFDTVTGINAPGPSPALNAFAKGMTVMPAGDLQVVRLDLAADRLATLGSEGKAWVLSLGSTMLAPTEPIALTKTNDANGLYQVDADLMRPGRVHQFTDPIVGDSLTVVTAFPPARGIVRDLSYVDFDALRSVHGLVIKPERDDVTVKIDGTQAIIAAAGGLTVSPPDSVAVVTDPGIPTASRTGFLDLASLKVDNPAAFNTKGNALATAAAAAEGAALDKARMQLASFYLANRFAIEAIGVLGVLQSDGKTDALRTKTRLMLAAADVVAARPADALPILNSAAFADDADAKMWRSLAEADSGQFGMARRDAIAALPMVASYPGWVRAKFLLAGVRAAVETGDTKLAEQLYGGIEFASLDHDQTTLYRLLAGRIAEAEGRTDEALDTYGQVIAADVRPTRAEAVYRTILILDQTGKVDPVKATRTLAAEALLWRGDALEASMDKLLAELYFRSGQYRDGFETAKQALQYFPESPDMDSLGAMAQNEFSDLYLNGKADQLKPVEALGLYYDFRNLTPPGPVGDQMIRNLAQRLVKVDLLAQAAQLLKYQIDNRLKGAAQAQIANELAVIQIANRHPDQALQVLNSTQLADLPPSLDRQRRILQARALIDASRTDLALDILTPVTGRDADQLRVEANWDAKNYADAARLIEAMYAPDAAGSSGPGLTQTGRMDIVRAAVAFALADDKDGLLRLRTKFSDALAKGPEWSMFNYVTSSIEPVTSDEFGKVAKAVASSDTLDAFLAGYKQVYGDEAAMTPDAAAPADGSTPVAANDAPPAQPAG